jgi:hypothetical protein
MDTELLIYARPELIEQWWLLSAGHGPHRTSKELPN